jgi:hypothetical protein
LLTRFLLSLINFHLFVYSMRLMNWVIRVTGGGNRRGGAPEVYLDCTGERGSYSDELARACVEGDLETLERYIRASLRLRTLDRFVTSSNLKAGMPDRETQTEEYLKGLPELASEVRIQARADQEFEQICAENGLNMNETTEEHEVTEAAIYLRDLRDSFDLDSLDRLVRALFEAQRTSAMKNVTGWFYSVSGFNRPYGVISGNTRGARRVARYTLSNELLSTLLHVALADHGWEEGGRLVPAVRLPLREFLTWLERRYGLVIGRPPATETSAEAVEAARRNLEAMKVRLRQIGVFQNLSDDFDAQYLQRPTTTAGGVR